MSDLEKCKDSLCPSKESCLRFTKIDSIINVTANFNREDDADNCNKYINNGLTNLKTNKIMKQTAVEFLVNKLANLIPSGNQILIRAILIEAKEMEKQQIINAHIHGCENMYSYTIGAEQYYNQTFNK